MERRKFTREFELEAVRLIMDRGNRMRRPSKTCLCISRSYAVG